MGHAWAGRAALHAAPTHRRVVVIGLNVVTPLDGEKSTTVHLNLNLEIMFDYE